LPTHRFAHAGCEGSTPARLSRIIATRARTDTRNLRWGTATRRQVSIAARRALPLVPGSATPLGEPMAFEERFGLRTPPEGAAIDAGDKPPAARSLGCYSPRP